MKLKTLHRSERQRAREQTADPHQPAAQEPATQEPATQEPTSEKPPTEEAARGTDTVPRHIHRPMGWAHTGQQVTLIASDVTSLIAVIRIRIHTEHH
jgi:hypothetical protein